MLAAITLAFVALIVFTSVQVGRASSSSSIEEAFHTRTSSGAGDVRSPHLTVTRLTD